VDVALGALRDDLNSRVHPSSGPGRDRGWRPGRGQVPPQSRPSPAVAQLRSDRLGVMWNVQEARRRGLDPAALWPGQAGLPGRPVLSLPASGGWNPRVPARPGRARAGTGKHAKLAAQQCLAKLHGSAVEVRRGPAKRWALAPASATAPGRCSRAFRIQPRRD
jgi:hypothetical protein